MKNAFMLIVATCHCAQGEGKQQASSACTCMSHLIHWEFFMLLYVSLCAMLTGKTGVPSSEAAVMAEFDEVMGSLESWFDLQESKVCSRSAGVSVI